MRSKALEVGARGRILPVLMALLLAAAALVLWRPLVAWFTGAPVGGGGSASAGPKVKAGSLVIEASIAPDPPHQKDNVLRLRVSGANGAPVGGASVRVGYVMPAMGAMPEMRGQADVADQGGGRYDARFDLPMGGSWTLSVEVRSKAGSGAARFAITVGTTGLRSEGGSGTGPGTNSRARAAPQAGPTELEAPPLPARDLPSPALSALQDAFTAYEDVRARLAADRLEGVAQPATRVAEQMRAASSALSGQESEVSDRANQGAAAAGKLAAATSLDRARQQFGEVSRFLVALGASDARLQTGWHLFQCPMVKGFKKWFQKSPTLENPYMGQAMSTCGSKTDWQPTPPPAGPKGGGVSHEGHGHEADDVAFYTCSMHPSVEKKEPGTCPICSMNLSPVTYDETEGGAVLIDETRRQLIGLKTTKVERAPLSVAIRAIGRFTYDETRLKDVTLKVQGWVTRLRVSATGQPVKRGEVLFTVYSPELFAAQEEYILALASQKAAHAGGRSDYLVRAAEKKLRLWDVTPSQLAAIAKRATPIEDLPILAPASGYIIEKDVVEGAAVEPGKRLYRIAALDKVWIEAQVYELDLGQVKVGQKARISLPYQAGEALEGTVAYVYPYLDPTSRTGRVRIEVVNRDLAFKPDMYANVELLVDLGSRLQVPIDSVIYTGPRRLVFVDLGEGRIRPQEVTLGARDAERVEVKSGLTEGQMIVTSANFLVAAESRIRSAAEFWSDEPHTAPTAPAVRDVAPPPGQAGHAGH